MTKPTASFGTLLGVLLPVVACDNAQRPRLPVGPTPPPSAAPSPPPVAPTPPPGAPTPPPGSSGWLLGFVTDSSGLCIEGATVEVVAGQRLGETIVQETPCDAWSYGGGFEFKDLVPQVEMTLRASAPGWKPEAKTFLPFVGSGQAVLLTLSRIE